MGKERQCQLDHDSYDSYDCYDSSRNDFLTIKAQNDLSGIIPEEMLTNQKLNHINLGKYKWVLAHVLLLQLLE